MFASGTFSHIHAQDNLSIQEQVESTLQVDAECVVVPLVNSPLTTSQEDELKSLVNPLQESSNYAIELYEQVQQFVSDNT